MDLELKKPSAAKGILGDIVKKITSAISFALVAGLSGLAMNAFALGGADIGVKGLGNAVSGVLGGGGIAESLVGTSIVGSIPLGGSTSSAVPSISIPDTSSMSSIVSTIVMTLSSVTSKMDRIEAMLQEVGKTSIAIRDLTDLMEVKNREIDHWLAKADDWARIDKERAEAIELLEAKLEAALGRLNSITEALKPPGG